MRHFIDTFLEPALWFAADWSLRWGALLAVVALILWIFRPHRAAIRQLYLLVALMAGLLVPFAPRWGGWEQTHEQSVSTSSFPRSAWERTSGRSAARPTSEPDAAQKSDATQSVAVVPSHAPRGNEGMASSEPLGRRRLIVLALASCWCCVVVYLLMRHFCGWFLLWRLRRESVQATGSIADLFAACRAEMRVRGAVRLATHPHVRSPILLGSLRPCILVPPDWSQRSIASQRAGLLHELAHVRRRDHLLAPLLETVRIAFFFHPLVRWLLARLEHERELLCDEMVVRLGIDRREYAHLLLEFARSSGRLAWPAVSLPMSRRRTVKDRIHHLLEEDMERWIRPLPLRWAVVLGCGLLALSMGLASYRVWAEERKTAEALLQQGERKAAANKSATTIKREDLRYGGKDFYQWRRELLTELKPSIRVDGLTALGTFGANGYGAEAAQAILDMMRGYDPIIENATDNQDGPVVHAGFKAVFKIGVGGVPTLAAATKEENRNVRRFAVEALGRMARDAEPALPALLQAIKNDDPFTRQLAVGAVGSIGRGTKDAVAALSEARKDKTDEVRYAAVDALGNLGEPAIPALMLALSDEDHGLRLNAARYLFQLGAGAKAVPAVSRLLQDKNNEIRKQAFEHLEKLKPEEIKEAVPALIAVLKDPQWVFRAINLLEKIGPAAKDAVPALNELLRSEDPPFRIKALEALRKISPDDKR